MVVAEVRVLRGDPPVVVVGVRVLRADLLVVVVEDWEVQEEALEPKLSY